MDYRGCSVIPKSSSRPRIQENFDILSFELTTEQVCNLLFSFYYLFVLWYCHLLCIMLLSHSLLPLFLLFFCLTTVYRFVVHRLLRCLLLTLSTRIRDLTTLVSSF